MNKIKILWYVLILMQLFIYSILFTKGFFKEYTTEFFIFLITTSASISCLLNYIYYCHKNNKSYTKKDTLLILIISWFVSVLLILPVLLFGYIMIALFLVWFLFTNIFIGIKYIFKKEEI